MLDSAEGSAQGVLFGVAVTADVLLQSIRFGSLRDYSGDAASPIWQAKLNHQNHASLNGVLPRFREGDCSCLLARCQQAQPMFTAAAGGIAIGVGNLGWSRQERRGIPQLEVVL